MAVLGHQFALARFFTASHAVVFSTPLRVTIAKKLTDNGVIPILLLYASLGGGAGCVSPCRAVCCVLSSVARIGYCSLAVRSTGSLRVRAKNNR